MKLYAAIDLHSNNSVVGVSDENDRVLYERRLPNDLGKIVLSLEPYRRELIAVAVESTFNWYWLVDGLMDAGYEVKLVNTSAVKVYDGMKYTDDEHDARHLAHLLRLGILPTGYICPKEERAVRDLLRKRSQLMRYRTAQLLSIENLVYRNAGQKITIGKIRELDEATMSRLCEGNAHRAQAIQSNLNVLRCLDAEIACLEKTVLASAKTKPVFETLQTVAGVGKILGMTILYETGAIDRFKKVGQYASYARCVDSQRFSNHKKKGSGNAKNGNKYLGWAFVEAVPHAWRSSDRIRQFYQRKKAKRNTTVAIKAVAHKLARATYHVLKDQVPFDVDRAFA